MCDVRYEAIKFNTSSDTIVQVKLLNITTEKIYNTSLLKI
jgi:hypothetical protein